MSSIPTSDKRTVLITGCTPGGIGNSLAREFHTRGLHVFATARNTAAIKDLEAIGIETLALDVTDESDITAAKEQVESKTGGTLDFLINNAGRNYTVPALDVSLPEARATFETNFFAIVKLTQAFAPLLIAAVTANANRSTSSGTSSSSSHHTTAPTIVNIGSLAAKMPYVFGSIYNASKAALHSYSETLAVELAPFGVHVAVIVTGGVKSNIARTHRELPESSYYRAIEAKYVERQTHSQSVGMGNEEYAKSVVDEVLRERSWWEGWWGGRRVVKWVWRGASAALVKWVTRFGLTWVVAEKFYRDFGLRELQRWWVAEEMATTTKKKNLA